MEPHLTVKGAKRFPADYLSREEIRSLLKTSDVHGWVAVITSWGLIAASMGLVAWFPNPWTWMISGALIGGRQLGLGILMHDCSHRTLFRTRSLNDWVGAWLCAYPTWQDLSRYRPHHARHHALAGTTQDPDLALVANYPTSRGSILRKFFRDLSGLTFLRRVFGLLAMDAGFIEYTVAGEVRPVAGAWTRGRWNIARTMSANLGPVLLTNSFLAAVLWAFGHPELYLLWLFSWAVFFSLFVRIRSIAELGGTEMDTEPARHTRTTQAGWLARLTVAPHHVNYHLEHHLLFLVPQQNLRRMNEILKGRGYHADSQAFFAENYRQVLRELTRG